MHLANKIYQSVLKPILFRFDPETIHDAFIRIGRMAGAALPTRRLLSALYDYEGPDISKTVDGITYRTPVLLSAGFDPDGELTRTLPSLGFGGEEIGSVTACPCAGNPKPRLTRLVRNRSIVVYKGLRNSGVEVLVKKLQSIPRVPGFVLGISIARTNDQETCTDLESGITDYVTSLRTLTESVIGDYYTINISCPNSYGGESFTEPETLKQLFCALDDIPCVKPIYVKMPINLAWSEFSALLDVLTKHRVQGVVIGNLNKNYSELDFPADAPKRFRGGVSGRPCFARAIELVRLTRKTYGTRFTIFGVGGILDSETAVSMFEAGADLIQVITGLIFNGPGFATEICDAYVDSRQKVTCNNM